ncbi:MAG TPA: response regulator [Syntrophorhabdaceae bacterium]
MSKANILIVEDELIVAHDIQYSLNVLGYMTMGIVSSGEGAIAEARKSRPDLALMDIRLKGAMDGIETAQILREELDIPVIYLTAYADEGTLDRAKVTGPFGYILKPFNEKDLSSTIEMALYKHRMDRQLKESEERYRQLVELSPDIIVVHKEGRIEFINAAGARLLGADDPGTFIGNPFFGIVDKSFHGPLRDAIDRIARQRESHPVLEGKYVRSDGQRIDVEVVSVPITYKGAPAIQSVARDITGRKRLETQFLHAQKMEAVGTLAGAIAHDFNNILTAIIGCGNLLLMGMKESPLERYVAQILSSGEKAANLTRSLLSFSRKMESHPEPVELNGIIKRIGKLLARLIGEEVNLSTSLSDRDLMVRADAGQIEQILMNLATNAKDAMPEGGILAINTGRITMDDQFISVHGYGAPGEYAVITVADTGQGIERETAPKIFEPFFTTKELGKGTGLGLSTVYGIVKQHKGYINVYSELGKGTLFTIYLPLIASKTEEKGAEEHHFPPTGNEVILLAEDDDQARDLIKKILESHGYKVIATVDGEDALDAFKSHSDRITLAIFDVIMPKKGGKAVYEEMAKTNPGLRVLFMSGYTAEVIEKKGVLEQKVNFIQKPIMPDKLLRKVRDVIDRE